MSTTSNNNDTVRVVSWNMNYAVGDRMRSQAGFIKKLQPDLLCLQEVNLSSAQELVERAGLDWLVSGVALRPSKQDDTPVRKRGSAIAGRGTAPVRTWLLDDVPLPERLVLAEVKLHEMTWTVASYHAPPGVTWREKKAKQAVGFARWLQGVQAPTVVGGDFNTPEVDALDFRRTRTHLHTGHRWLGEQFVPNDIEPTWAPLHQPHPSEPGTRGRTFVTASRGTQGPLAVLVREGELTPRGRSGSPELTIDHGDRNCSTSIGTNRRAHGLIW